VTGDARDEVEIEIIRVDSRQSTWFPEQN